MKTARCALMLVLSTAACHSGGPGVGAHAGTGGGAAGTGGAAGMAGRDAAADAPADAGAAGAPAIDPGRVTLHRLTRFEYDNTVKDLLGVTSSPADRFPEDDLVDGFDNLAEGLHMSGERYLKYLDAAKTLVDATWADEQLRARIVTCAEDTDGKCASDVIGAFGLRAWRRPLTSAELQSIVAFYGAARAETGDFQKALGRVVTMMLSSLPFLYKVEIDPERTSTTPHPLTGHELASRLSYLVWGSMPDDDLLRLGNALRLPAVLTAQLDRMLDSPKSEGFARGFAGRWLGVEELATHQVDVSAYPRWDSRVAPSLMKEMYLYFADFRDRPVSAFLTDDLHFVDGRLSLLYRLSDIPSDAPVMRVAKPADHAGFLGLAGFLTLTSPPNRTSPSRRGSWIVEHLLCDPAGEHPAGIMPSLNLSPTDNVRKALVLSTPQATCHDCHAAFDGAGLGLEHFDGIGTFREKYSDTEAIDASGALGAATFDGAAQLAAAVAHDPRFAPCVARKALTYALGRQLGDADRALVAGVTASWKQGSFRELLHTVVGSDAFQTRHGEAP